jgi:putative phage-type endonuclease
MPLTDEDRAQRATAIGSSDIAALVDLDPFRGPTDVWLDKMGLSVRRENVAQWTGHKLEPVIAAMYAEKTGAELVPGGGTERHPDIAWAVATVDFRATVGPAPVVEIKNVGAWALRHWYSGAPVEKVLQAQWQMMVCDVERVHIAALIGGTDFRIHPVERDEELIEWLADLAAKFWTDHVIGRTPPPDNGEARGGALDALYQRSSGLLLPRTTEAEQVYACLLDAKERKALVEAEEVAAENAAKEFLGEAAGVDGLFSWNEARGKIDWKAAAQAAGVSDKDAERYRGKPHRVLQLKKPRKNK